MKKLTKEEFISKAKIIHGGKYDYSLVEYINNSTKIKIICLLHGIFEQVPFSHLGKRGCPKCKSEKLSSLYLMDQNTFIEKAKLVHGDKYDYSLVNYIGNKYKIEIICSIHGKFSQLPQNHLRWGCLKCCHDNRKYNTDMFIKKANIFHKNKYDYSKSVYKGSNKKVKIICPKHGSFYQIPRLHMHKSGCPKCRESKGETFIREFLENNNILYERQYMFSLCKHIKKLPFDFYLPDFNCCIEFNGKQHYVPVYGEKDFEERIRNDKIKQEYCKNNNIKLIIIKYISEITKKLQDFQKSI